MSEPSLQQKATGVKSEQGKWGADGFHCISVVVPAYNEEKGIGQVLQQIYEVLMDSKMQFEIIVVDDGSEDETASIAGEIAGTRVVRHRANRGYGAALKTGIDQAHYEMICITDADSTYPIARIPDLAVEINARSCDMVVGARVGKHASIPLLRRPAKWIIAQLAQIVVNESIPDINSGLRVFKRSVALRFFDMLPQGFSFTTTLTLGLLTNGYSVEYIPIEYYPRVGKSKIRPLRDTLNFIQLIFRIALYFSPLKIFIPLSGVLFLLGLTWGFASFIFFGRVADASTAVLLTTAVQVAVVGLLADLINRRLPGYQRFEDSRDLKDE